MRATQLAGRRARLLRNALITALVPGLLINPATPLNPLAQAFMIADGFGGDFGGGGWGDWGGGIDTWMDAAAGNEGAFPDNGSDNVPDQTDGLDNGGDEWTDPGDPDSDPAPGDADGNEDDPDDSPDEEEDEGPPETPNSCGSPSAEVAGDPINLARADKVHFQVDYRGRDLAPLRASRAARVKAASRHSSMTARGVLPV